ncbi:B12-binding domain-containing radical SAM protein [bacterium]|nr:B12-binding domain-containing radical SAM protein [bacterium]
MKCTLIRCPQTFHTFVSAAPAVPPLGLAYVAAALQRAGHAVRIVDPTGEAIDRFTPIEGWARTLRRGLSDDEILERIAGSDVIGFSLMFSQDWLVTRALIAKVRARFPDSVLIAGGEHFTAEPVGALAAAPGLDYVLVGEGDRSACELFEHLEGRRPLESVAGVYYRERGRAGGPIRRSAGMARVRDVDALPWPAWELVPLENYLAGGHGWGVDRGRNVPMNATRGCPYQCTFCSSPTMWTTRWVARDPADVVAEIGHYVATYRATNFDFQDLTAIIRKSWLIEFCQRLLAADLRITWQLPTGTRSEALDADVLPLLVASGCTNITYAPESGNPRTLQRIKKKVRLDRMQRSMRAAVRAGCNVKANFIFGFPGETYGDLLRSFGFLARLAVIGVHDISIAPFRPYPGSELFRELQATGVLPNPLDDDYYRRLASAAENMPGTSAGAESFSVHLSSAGLNRVRAAGFAWFFLLSWLLRPQRVLRLCLAVWTEKQESRLDKSLVEMKRRVQRRLKGEQFPSPTAAHPY